MIIIEDVKVRDRKSLRTVKAFLKEQRDEQRERVARGTTLFVEKWNVDRFSDLIAKRLIPEAISRSLHGAVSKLFLNEKSGDTSGLPTWKRIIIDTLERLIPQVVKQVLK